MRFLYPTVHVFLEHKSKKLNRVADTLNHRATLLITMKAEVTGFKCLKEFPMGTSDLRVT
jgi:hypothetical protein